MLIDTARAVADALGIDHAGDDESISAPLSLAELFETRDRAIAEARATRDSNAAAQRADDARRKNELIAELAKAYVKASVIASVVRGVGSLILMD